MHKLRVIFKKCIGNYHSCNPEQNLPRHPKKWLIIQFLSANFLKYQLFIAVW